jgi:hypothetical protein
MARKYPAVDLIKLYAESDCHKWNYFLSKCLANHDIGALARMYYGIQCGMTDLKQNTLLKETLARITNQFIRWERSIRETIKKIYREKYPSPLDNPTLAAKAGYDAKMAKRLRDDAFERLMKDLSF